MCVDPRIRPGPKPARGVTPAALALVVFVTTGCNDLAESPPTSVKPSDGRRSVSWTVRSAAGQLLQNAAAGMRRRGEQDVMLRLEGQAPGFGGFFIDSLGEVVVWMKPVTATPNAEAIRATLLGAYSTHRNSLVRDIMAPASRARVQAAAYSLSELIAFEDRIVSSPVRIPGYVGAGTSIFLNRVKIGFATAADSANGVRVAESIGVPRDVLLPEVWGELATTSNWDSYIRPTRGGIKVHVAAPWGRGGSHGFNVRTATGVEYFLTAAHTVNSAYATNGYTGAPVYQPDPSTLPSPLIGTITVNYPWAQAPNCSGYDYCTSADVAAGSFAAGVTGERKVGTSVTEGTQGGQGTQAINGWYGISGTVSPEFIQQSNRNVVHKSGMTTGTTTGGIDLPCMTLGGSTEWGAPGVLKTVQYICVSRVAFGGWGKGDSGGPVFARKVSGGPYFALGIQFGGTPAPSSGNVCTAGQSCAFYFSRWEAIEGQLGLGPLDPAT